MTPAAVEERYGVAAGPLPRARGAGGRDLGQPARRARGGPQDRREVDQHLRRPRQRDHPRGGDHRQDGREPSRAPRRRDPQPQAQRAGLRPATCRSAPTDLARPAVGPPGGAHALRRPGVPGAAGPAVRDPGVRGGHRRLRLRPGHDPPRARPGRRLAGGHAREGAAGRRARRGVVALGHRRRARRWRSRPWRAPRAHVVVDEGSPRGRRRDRVVARRPRTSPRCCTTPRARCSRSPPVAGR